MELNKNWRPPAITTGLVPFYLILHFLNLSEKLRLTPDALFHIDLNRLSFYPLVFLNLAHLIVGVALFTPLCGQFELHNGTVRTGIVLNVSCFFPAILDNIIVKISGGRIGTTDFCGTSGWILTFAAFLSVRTWSLPVVPFRSLMISFPAWIFPIIFYVVLSVLRPAFILQHTLSLLFGIFLGTGHLGFLVEGTTTVVAWIESKIERLIAFLRYIVHFVGEVEARDLRRITTFSRRGSIQADDIPLPAAHTSL